jgi:hypothetical protein
MVIQCVPHYFLAEVLVATALVLELGLRAFFWVIFLRTFHVFLHFFHYYVDEPSFFVNANSPSLCPIMPSFIVSSYNFYHYRQKYMIDKIAYYSRCSAFSKDTVFVESIISILLLTMAVY